jgi:hypothetical protein
MDKTLFLCARILQLRRHTTLQRAVAARLLPLHLASLLAAEKETRTAVLSCRAYRSTQPDKAHRGSAYRRTTLAATAVTIRTCYPECDVSRKCPPEVLIPFKEHVARRRASTKYLRQTLYSLPTMSNSLPKGNKVLDIRATLVFERVHRFYQTFNIIATLLGSLALAVLTFDDFHIQHGQPLMEASAGLLTSSALTAVVAVMIATMLLFKFEGHEHPTRRELAIAWIPLVLVDLVIVEFLFGITLWYAARSAVWRASLMGGQLVVLLVLSIVLAVWMWNSMKEKGGLGEEERKLTRQTVRVADK